MRILGHSVAAALITLALNSYTCAADQLPLPESAAGLELISQAIPTLEIDQFIVGMKSTTLRDRERAAALDGAEYAVVAPVYLGAGGGMISYLRLFNGGASAATFTVKVVGSPTGRDYGTATFEIPAAATRQYSLSQVLQAASATVTDPDTNFSFYIQSSEPLAGYQHVTHSPTVSYFENAAVCKETIQQTVDVASKQMVLPSIHTSQLAAAGYPSSIELHNYANTTTTYRLSVRDEFSGVAVGQMDVTAQANASYTIPWSQIENEIGWTPTVNQIRANLIVTDPSGASPAILLGQTIFNNALQVNLNMTTMCAVNARARVSSPNTFTLELDRSGAGFGDASNGGSSGRITSSPAGIDCGSVANGAPANAVCRYEFTAGTSVTLNLGEGNGVAFRGWSGACSGADICTIVMDADKTVTASYGPPTTFKLTLERFGTGFGDASNGGSSGLITSSPAGINCGTVANGAPANPVCTYWFAPGTSVTLNLGAGNGVAFRGWSGACTGTGECTILMNADQTVTANYGSPTASTFMLTLDRSGAGFGDASNGGSSGRITSSPAGIDCGSVANGAPANAVCNYAFTAGTSVTLNLGAGNGVAFRGWTGACSGAGVCTVVMNADQTVTANYGAPPEAETFELILEKSGTGFGDGSNGGSSGLITSSPAGIDCGSVANGGSASPRCRYSFPAGTSVTLILGAGNGIAFRGWSGACTGGGTCTLVMNSNQSVTANYGPP